MAVVNIRLKPIDNGTELFLRSFLSSCLTFPQFKAIFSF